MKDLAAPDQTRETRQTQTLRDPDRVASLMFPERHVLDVAASGTGLTVDVLRLAEEGLKLGRVVSGGHEIMLEDPDNITLLLPEKGRIAMQTGDGERSFGSGSLNLVLSEKRRTRVIAPEDGVFRATTVQVPRARLAALLADDAASVGGTDHRAFQTIDSAFSRQVGRMLPALSDAIFGQHDRLLPPRARAEFVNMIDDLLVDLVGLASAEARIYGGLREFQRVSQACDIIRARAEEPLSIAGLAKELQVTPRSLQLSFRAVHGMSPRQYLERVRLDRVRDRILSQAHAGSITVAAMDSGFTHLSRFSQIYRRTFGELPSETAARRQSKSARNPL